MGNGAMILRMVDNWFYNAGLTVALAIVLFGVMLCLTALPRPDDRTRRASRLAEEGAFRVRDDA